MVLAQTPTDVFFEDVRGQLLQYFSSEVVAHSGLIIGLIIGSFALLAAWEDFGKSRRKQIVFFLLLGLAFSLTLYSVGRLFYWSYLGSDILLVNASEYNIGDSNATMLIKAIHDRVITDFQATESLYCNLARFLQPNFSGFDSVAWLFLKMLVLTFLPLAFWFSWQDPPQKWQKKNLKWYSVASFALIILLIMIVVLVWGKIIS